MRLYCVAFNQPFGSCDVLSVCLLRSDSRIFVTVRSMVDLLLLIACMEIRAVSGRSV